jgi:hypothetical protein
MKAPQRKAEVGSFALAIILVLLIGGMFFFLYGKRRASESEGREFADNVIQHCAFGHDVNFLRSVVAENRRLAVPPAKDQEFIDILAKLGTPDRNYSLTGNLQFDNYFFSPQGVYKSILTFPDRHGTFFVSVARPGGTWLVEDYGIVWERPPD